MLAKERRFIERFKTHAPKAAQVQSRIKAAKQDDKIELREKAGRLKFRLSAFPPRSATRWRGDRRLLQTIEHGSPRVIYDGFLTIRRGEALGRDGRNARGQN